MICVRQRKASSRGGPVVGCAPAQISGRLSGRRKRPVIVVVATLFFGAFGDICGDTPATEFNAAASRHKAELRDLLRSRGASPPMLADASVESVSAVLNCYYLDGTAVLFYAYTEPTLSAWLLDERGLQGYGQVRVEHASLDSAVTNLRRALGVTALQVTRAPRLRGVKLASLLSHTGGEDATQAAAEISRLLFPPTLAKGLANVKHLIVVPVLNIGTVPFAMLKPPASQRCLADTASVSIAPSLFDIGQQIDRDGVRVEPFRSAVVVGDPDLSTDRVWLFPALPGARKEALAVAKAFGTEAIVGPKATKSLVLKKASSSELLYFATHGIADEVDPLNGSFLALSAPEGVDGGWTAKEIQFSHLRARLAVLSACQTGLGQIHDAGIIGLARAFQIAGVPRVVMSLWSVRDEATAELMQAFVKHLNSSVPAEALRQAMCEVKERRPDPAEWASFVLFGTPR